MDVNSKIYSSEIGTALTDYSYGSNVLMRIKSMTPMTNASKTLRLNKSNIINKNIDDLKLQSISNNTNSVNVYVPLELCRYKIPVHPTHPAKDWSWEGPAYDSGKAGDQFVITFIGGDPTKPVAIRKV